MLDKLNASFIPHLSSLIVKVLNRLFTPPLGDILVLSGCPFFITASKIAGEKTFCIRKFISNTPVPHQVKNARLTASGL